MIERNAANADSREDRDRMTAAVEKMRNPEEVQTATDLALSESMTELMFRFTDRSLATVFENEYEIWVERKKALFSSWY